MSKVTPIKETTDIESKKETRNSSFMNAGGVYKIIPNDNAHLLPKLPAQVYNPVITQEGELLLQPGKSSYNTPKRTYGTIVENTNIIFKDYIEFIDTNALGVMLHGIKGNGKSMLAEMLANLAIVSDVPVFEISSKIPASYIKRICEKCNPCVLYIDEVDRVYSNDYGSPDMDSLVSVIGASSNPGVLTIITTNNPSTLPNAFIHRPSRFKYNISYNALSASIIKEAVNDIVKRLKSAGEILTISESDVISRVMMCQSVMTFDLLNHMTKVILKYEKIEDYDKMAHIYNFPKSTDRLTTIHGAIEVSTGKYYSSNAINWSYSRNSLTCNNDLISLPQEKINTLGDGHYKCKSICGNYIIYYALGCTEESGSERRVHISNRNIGVDEVSLYQDIDTIGEKLRVVNV